MKIIINAGIANTIKIKKNHHKPMKPIKLPILSDSFSFLFHLNFQSGYQLFKYFLHKEANKNVEINKIDNQSQPIINFLKMIN